MKKHLLTLLAFTLTATAFATESWQTRLKEQLPLLGHRNWIVVADSAYPLQTAPGIETICANAEMRFVAEKNAPGIGVYREALAKILGNKSVQVLIIKTPLTLPYTSVFFQLECGYWNAASEKELRDALK